MSTETAMVRRKIKIMFTKTDRSGQVFKLSLRSLGFDFEFKLKEKIPEICAKKLNFGKFYSAALNWEINIF